MSMMTYMASSESIFPPGKWHTFSRGQRINEKSAIWQKIANYVSSEPLPSKTSPSSQNTLLTLSNLM